MTLYEIDKRIEELTNAVDPETGELMVDVDAIEALAMEREQKIENIACYIKNLNSDVSELKNEEKALAERRKTAEKKAERLKNFLVSALDGQKFSTSKCAVSIRKSQSVEVDDSFIDWAVFNNNDSLLRYKSPEVDKTAVKNLLDTGATLPYARLKENYSVIIK